jgi:hypothetical protein
MAPPVTVDGAQGTQAPAKLSFGTLAGPVPHRSGGLPAKRRKPVLTNPAFGASNLPEHHAYGGVPQDGQHYGLNQVQPSMEYSPGVAPRATPHAAPDFSTR